MGHPGGQCWEPARPPQCFSTEASVLLPAPRPQTGPVGAKWAKQLEARGRQRVPPRRAPERQGALFTNKACSRFRHPHSQALYSISICLIPLQAHWRQTESISPEAQASVGRCQQSCGPLRGQENRGRRDWENAFLRRGLEMHGLCCR